MRRELAIEFSRVTEAAALAGYKWLGRGDKNLADGAAVEAMRFVLNQIDISGEIVIGEGEIDEAPMLYIGEKVGSGGEEVEIAVDPIDGTRMTAMGQANAVAVLAAGDKGCFMQAPDMYMEKLIVGYKAKGSIDLNKSLEDNIRSVAAALNKPIHRISVITLAKPRHEEAIRQMQQMGVRVFAIPDGDVAASVLTCMPEIEIDMLYCIGGAPEGIVSAAVTRALDGDMQGRLWPRHKVKGDCEENRRLGAEEIARCEKMGVAVEQVGLHAERRTGARRVHFVDQEPRGVGRRPVMHHHVGARRVQFPGDRSAHALRRTGDQYRFADQDSLPGKTDLATPGNSIGFRFPPVKPAVPGACAREPC